MYAATSSILDFRSEFNRMVRITHGCHTLKVQPARVIKTKVSGAIPPAAYRAEFQGTRLHRSWGGRGRTSDAEDNYALHTGAESIMVQAIRLVGASQETGQAP